MNARAKSIGKLLEELARDILKSASHDDTPLPDKLEAFKIVTTYHIGVTKATKGRDPDDGATGSFDKLRQGLRTVGGKDA